MVYQTVVYPVTSPQKQKPQRERRGFFQFQTVARGGIDQSL